MTNSQLSFAAIYLSVAEQNWKELIWFIQNLAIDIHYLYNPGKTLFNLYPKEKAIYTLQYTALNCHEQKKTECILLTEEQAVKQQQRIQTIRLILVTMIIQLANLDMKSL